MGWESVPICNEHWIEEEGKRTAYRLKEAARSEEDLCYRCGRVAEGIFVRRNIPEADGTFIAACARCAKEVHSAKDEVSVIVLGMTYDDMAVAIMFHRHCYEAMERISIPPRAYGDAFEVGEVAASIIEDEATYPVGEYIDVPDRKEDV